MPKRKILFYKPFSSTWLPPPNPVHPDTVLYGLLKDYDDRGHGNEGWPLRVFTYVNIQHHDSIPIRVFDKRQQFIAIHHSTMTKWSCNQEPILRSDELDLYLLTKIPTVSQLTPQKVKLPRTRLPSSRKLRLPHNNSIDVRKRFLTHEKDIPEMLYRKFGCTEHIDIQCYDITRSHTFTLQWDKSLATSVHDRYIVIETILHRPIPQ